LIIGILLLNYKRDIGGICALQTLFPGWYSGDAVCSNPKQQFSNFFHDNSSNSSTGIPAVLLVIALVLIIWWRLGKLEAIFMAAAGVLSPIANLFKLSLNSRDLLPPLLISYCRLAASVFPAGMLFSPRWCWEWLFILYSNFVASKPLKTLLVSFLAFYILLVGYSRVYLGVHWGSEVIESYLIAGGFLLLLTALYEQINISKARRNKSETKWDLKELRENRPKITSSEYTKSQNGAQG